MTELTATGLSVNVDNVALLSGATLSLGSGELVAILGPNGAGKTTLLRALLGLTPMVSGKSVVDGENIADLSPMQRARRISYLPQQRPLAWPNSVRDVVSLGRFAHGAALGRLGNVDAHAVDDAIEACNLVALANRRTDNLSGGELARVHFARALAAQTPLLVADEPVAALDPRHQLSISDLIRRYVDGGGGALVVLHEVSLAARFADRLLWMRDGRIVADGSPKDTLTAERMRDIYGVDARVELDNEGFDVRIKSAL